MIAAAALTTCQVLRIISSACIQMRLRPDRPIHRHPRHPPNPYRAWLATGAANREARSVQDIRAYTAAASTGLTRETYSVNAALVRDYLD
jgi:hypothetical protein